jgi:hypothetical protein
MSYSEQIGSAKQTQLVSDQASKPRDGNRVMNAVIGVTVVMMILLGVVSPEPHSSYRRVRAPRMLLGAGLQQGRLSLIVLL